MNIFYLHPSPYTSARMQCDKHVVKMILETAQLLSTAHREIDGDDYADSNGLYKRTHKNHPSAVWVRQSHYHYLWTFEHFRGLLDEYTKRYGKTHASARLLVALSRQPRNISVTPFVAPPQCMPDAYKQSDTVRAYRAYYLADKAYMAKWAYSTTPAWFSSADPSDTTEHPGEALNPFHYSFK